MPVDEVRKLIIAIDNKKTEYNSPPFTPYISERLRELIEVPEPINEKSQLINLNSKLIIKQ